MNRAAPIWVAAFPVILVVGVLTIPVVADYGDHELAAAAAHQTARWYWGHLLSALAFAVAAIAAVAVQSRLRRMSTEPPAIWAVPLVVAGACCHVYGLGADGIGPVATLVGGGSPKMYFDGLGSRLIGVFVAGAGAFSVGWIGLMTAATRTGVVRGWRRWWLPTGVLLMAAAEAIPSGWGLYAVAALALAVWLPLSKSLAQPPAA